MMYGYGIGILELLFFGLISSGLKNFLLPLKNINSICYYWLCMTILTGIWEVSYITNYNEIVSMAETMINNNTHAWTNKYSVDYVIPWKLAKIFYAEYGAWADRQYMSVTNPWSHTVEGTHAAFCAFFSLLGMITRLDKKTTKSMVLVGMAMAFQLMNSILYMVEYGIQCSLEGNVNYNNETFPLGTLMSKRPFMYVNLFWMLMPTYIILYELFNNTINNNTINNNTINNNTINNETNTLQHLPPPPPYMEKDNKKDNKKKQAQDVKPNVEPNVEPDMMTGADAMG